MQSKNEIINRIEIIEGDLTRQKTDAIVNAANSSLLGGGGVDGAIHRAAGPDLLKECRRLRETDLPEGLPTGQAVMTQGYNLPASQVIHTVGPVWRGGQNNEAQLLADCYKNSLAIAARNQFESIAFPAVSTGVYRFPLIPAAGIAIQTVQSFLTENKFPRRVIFVVIGENVTVYRQLLAQIR